MWYPIFMSVVLFSFYLLFKFFKKEYINFLLGLGVYCFKAAILPLFQVILPKSLVERENYKVDMEKIVKRITFSLYNTGEWIIEFNEVDIIAYLFALIPGIHYLVTKNWITSNIIGVSYAEFCELGSFKNGILLLGGLFFYDIFWVFSTDVMVTVALNFQGPVKILWPKPFADPSEPEKAFRMIGLGDIVLPGIFIALMIRFDDYLNKKGVKKNFVYFHACFISYIIGWVMAIGAVVIWQQGQPALLYLVPANFLSVIMVSLKRGEFKELCGFTEGDQKKKIGKSGEDDEDESEGEAEYDDLEDVSEEEGELSDDEDGKLKED